MKYIFIILMLMILSCGSKPSQEATEDTGAQETQETSAKAAEDDGKTHARLTSINEDVICEYGHITDCGVVLKKCNTGQSYYCFKDVIIK